MLTQRRDDLELHKREFALHPDDLPLLGLPDPPPASLEEIVQAVKPTVLIGTTGQPGDFTPAVLRAMADR